MINETSTAGGWYEATRAFHPGRLVPAAGRARLVDHETLRIGTTVLTAIKAVGRRMLNCYRLEIDGFDSGIEPSFRATVVGHAPPLSVPSRQGRALRTGRAGPRTRADR